MIEGQICYLRAVDPTDIDILYEWENDTTIWKDSDTRHPINRIAIEQLAVQATVDVYETRQTRLMVCNKETGIAVGCVDMFDFDPHNMHCGIGIMTESQYQQQGYATEAIKLMCNYLFDTLGMNTIYATMRMSNHVSMHLFEKCGFNLTGVKHSWIRVGKHFEDEAFMQINAII